MKTRQSLTTLGIALALASPLGASADGFWVTTRDEAGSRIVDPVFGQPLRKVAPDRSPPLRIGSLSPDGQYVYAGEEGSWQLRQMEYRFVNGRLTHVDEPAGHMNRLADTRPDSAEQKAARANSGGS
jgi:hypothetical protein